MKVRQEFKVELDSQDLSNAVAEYIGKHFGVFPIRSVIWVISDYKDGDRIRRDITSAHVFGEIEGEYPE